MRDVVIAIPDEQKVQADLLPLAARAEQLVVTTLEEHGYAQEYLKEVAQAERAVKQLFEDPKQAAFTAHRSICDAEHKLLDPLKRARQVVTKAIVTYEDIERQRALEEQRPRVEPVRALRLGQPQVPIMYRVERAAEDADWRHAIHALRSRSGSTLTAKPPRRCGELRRPR